jgi:N-acetylglutamate synthase-like GNAT family acetyltransferase
VQFQATLDSLRVPAARDCTLQASRVGETDLRDVAAFEEKLSGYSHHPDFQFCLSSGLGAGWTLRRDGRLVGCAFALLKRGNGVVGSLCVPEGQDVSRAGGVLLAEALPFFRAVGVGQVRVLASGEDGPLARFLMECGFRMSDTMIRMYRGARPGSARRCTPLASEKG